jgi:Bacterial membrane protein YfhO
VFNPTWLYVAALYAAAVWLARRRGVELPWRIAALCYALVLVFLFRPMTQAAINVPVDFVEILPPWSEQVGRPTPSNTMMNDLAMQIVPWAEQVRASWRSLQFPIWNHLSGSGYPLLANGQSSAFSPIRILALPLPLGYAMTAEAAMKLLIALTFMYLLCRRRYAELPSAFGAIAFAFCTFNNTWLHFPLVTVAVWLPAAMLATEMLLERRTYARFVFAVVVWSVMLFGGHPETVAHVTLFCGLFGLWLLFERPLPTAPCGDRLQPVPWRGPAALAGAIAVAAIVAAPFLATFAEAVTKSRRYHELQANPALNIDVPWSDFPSMIVLFQPHFFGHLPNDKPWSSAPGAESISGFAGLLGVAAWFGLLLRAIALRRLREREVFLLLIALFVFAVIMNWPGVGSFFHFVFRLAANARLRFLLCFVVALMTAAIVDVALRERPLWALSGVGVVGAGLLYLLMTTSFPTQAAVDTALLAMLPSIITLAAAALFALPARWRELGAMVVATAVVGELWSNTAGWNPVLPASAMYPRTPLIERLQSLRGRAPERVLGIGPALFPNANVIYGFEDVRAHDPMANGRYLGVLRQLAGMNTDDYFAKWNDIGSPLIDYLNVRWVVGARNLDMRDPDRFRLVYDARDGRIFENRAVLPRFYAARNVILEFKGDRFVQRLSAQKDFTHTAVVKELPVTGDLMRTDLLAPRPFGSPEATVAIVSARPTDFRLKVRAPRHGLVVSSQPWWPGWRVTLNGQRRAPQAVNGAFLGFTVPPGDWDVRVYYFPLTFWLGLAASLLTIVALVAVPLLRRARSRARSG